MNPDDNDKTQAEPSKADPAVTIIRAKIDSIYNKEPDPKQEIVDSSQAGKHRSKHQEFMYRLSTSGKSLAEIQTDWHNYYTSLPDDEKYAVWQEFYAEHGKSGQQAAEKKPEQRALPEPVDDKPKESNDTQSVADIKKQIESKIGKRAKLSPKHHIQSLFFGLSMGSLVILVLLFSFFNERFIAPFITPSRATTSTPIIIDPNSTAAGPNPEVIIPKINVEIPVVYGNSIEEKAIEKDLESGVAHYATTPSPGQQGNVAVVGHSSNNIFNKGKYKFAFVLLNKLEIGDTFSLTKDGKRYVYKIYEKKIVNPNDVSVLGNTNKPATATLITCDPPGTSLRRLVVIGEQISPDPNSNSASTAVPTDAKPVIVPGNSTSLWQRFINWIKN